MTKYYCEICNKQIIEGTGYSRNGVWIHERCRHERHVEKIKSGYLKAKKTLDKST